MIEKKLIEVKSRGELKQFIRFAHQLYKNDPNYVPQLNASVKWMLSPKNPFLKHSEIALFMVKSKGSITGRIASVYNQTHLDTYHDQTGFFGFFDSINDAETAQILLLAAEQWLKNKGLARIMGPANLTTNDSCGFLTHGFDKPPMFLMPYNFEYYIRLCENLGYSKVLGLNSYSINGNAILKKYSNVYQKGIENMLAKGIIVRSMSAKMFSTDVQQLWHVYNKVNEPNYGFMPLNTDEFAAMANDLKMVTPFDLALVVEKEKQIIGYLIAVPNLNEAITYVRNGKLFPTGLMKLLWYKRKITSARIMILGILPEYKGQGIDLVVYQKIKEALNRRNIYTAEACYVFENNIAMNSVLSKISEGITKNYAMYAKVL
jgi:ribosomal protein S18 acetylase RimI-like enzyme